MDKPAVLTAVVLRKFKQVLSSSLKQDFGDMTHSEVESDPSVLFVQYIGLICQYVKSSVFKLPFLCFFSKY